MLLSCGVIEIIFAKNGTRPHLVTSRRSGNVVETDTNTTPAGRCAMEGSFRDMCENERVEEMPYLVQ